jgi:hypothetical protein
MFNLDKMNLTYLDKDIFINIFTNLQAFIIRIIII